MVEANRLSATRPATNHTKAMKGTILLANACAAALLFSSAAWAENPGTVLDTSKLDEKKVTNAEGKELGEIERLLVDPKTGAVRFAVIEVGGGVFQLTEREVAVPWESLQMTPKEQGDFDVRLNATKEKLENAPQFKSGEADQLFTPEGAQNLKSYWGTSGQTQEGTPKGGTAASPKDWEQQFKKDKTDKPLTPGGQIDSPNVTTEENPGSSTPKSYYEENRERIDSSSEGQNNRPAGTQPADGSLSGEDDSPFRSGEQSSPGSQQESDDQPSGETSFPDESTTIEVNP